MRNDLGTMRGQLRRRADAPADHSRGWIPASGGERGASGPSLRTRISHGCSIRAEYAVRRSRFSSLEITVDKKADATSNVADAHGRAGTTDHVLSPEERHRRIAKAAYLRAAARDFAGGDPLHDWLAAEAEMSASVERKAPESE